MSRQECERKFDTDEYLGTYVERGWREHLGMGPGASAEGLEDVLGDEGFHTSREDCAGLERVGGQELKN